MYWSQTESSKWSLDCVSTLDLGTPFTVIHDASLCPGLRVRFSVCLTYRMHLAATHHMSQHTWSITECRLAVLRFAATAVLQRRLLQVVHRRLILGAGPEDLQADAALVELAQNWLKFS